MSQPARRHWARPIGERLAFPAVFALLGLAGLVIKTVPFKHVAKMLGPHRQLAPWIPVATVQQQRRAERVGALVRRAAHRTPWRSNCFPQSLVAATLLRAWRVPYAVYFGVSADPQPPDKINAHAWVCAGPSAIVGGNGFERYRVLACWAWVAGGPIPE